MRQVIECIEHSWQFVNTHPGVPAYAANDIRLFGFPAAAEARKQLLGIGFQHLSECEEWQLQPGGRYFFTRNMSSIYAFAVGRK